MLSEERNLESGETDLTKWICLTMLQGLVLFTSNIITFLCLFTLISLSAYIYFENFWAYLKFMFFRSSSSLAIPWELVKYAES